MFYLETMYLPLLQGHVRLRQMNYYVGLWFSQMWLYRFYFPLLIGLANDVETNPGPLFFVESSETVKSNHMSPEINQKCDSPSMSMLAFRFRCRYTPDKRLHVMQGTETDFIGNCFVLFQCDNFG